MFTVGRKEERRATIDQLGGSVLLPFVMDVQLFIIVQALIPFAFHLHVDFLTLVLLHMLKLGVFLLPLRPTGLAGQERHQVHPGPTVQFPYIPLHDILGGLPIAAEELVDRIVTEARPIGVEHVPSE
jgi:hypothetical protein